MAVDIIKEIYKDFEPQTKADWVQQATKDLKGKAIDDMAWDLNDDIKQAAYYTASDLPSLDHTVLKSHNPDWQIGEHYLVKDYKASNKQLLEDLMHGLNAPVLSFKNSPSLEDFKVLFNNIGLAHIDVHFDTLDNQVYLAWQNYIQAESIEGAKAYFRLETSLELVAKSEHIDARAFYTNTQGIHDEIKQTIQAVEALLQGSDDPSNLARQIHCSFFVDKSYLASIAKLRAFKLLFVALLKKHGIAEELPFISVEFSPDAYGEDEQDNLIHATTMAMSAAIGGANHLIVRPGSDTATAKRLARNIQLILKHESGLHKVADPAQGSYYIESLTNKLINYCH